MQKIARFEKVSFQQFERDFRRCFPEQFFITTETPDIEMLYNNIRLPERATKGSAGYDFFCPATILIESGHSITIPTGIRVKIDNGWVLKCYPKSGLGFRYGVYLNNTIGVIDAK